LNAAAIESVAVLGLGTMGHSIAQTFALASCRVCGFDSNPQTRASASDRIKANLEKVEAAGLTSSRDITESLSRIAVCSHETEALQDAQFVTEAVNEELEVKQELFARIERRFPRSASWPATARASR